LRGHRVHHLPGSGARNRQYEDLRALTEEAKRKGLAVVVWSYPRGAGISKDGETAVDIAGYAAQIAAQLGAHVIKVKPPKDLVEGAEAKKVFEKHAIPRRPSPIAFATSSRAPSTASASSSSRAARPRAPRRSWRRSAA